MHDSFLPYGIAIFWYEINGRDDITDGQRWVMDYYRTRSEERSKADRLLMLTLAMEEELNG